MRFKISFVLFGFIVLSPLSALTLKIASPFPEGSEWHNTLKAMSVEWTKISDGKIKTRIYAGGIASDNEVDLVRKMRIGQLDGAVLTIFGMKEITPDSFALVLPGLIRSEKELDYLLAKTESLFKEKFVQSGFRLLSWSKSGWAYFFTKKPIRTPTDMRRLKLSVNSSDVELGTNFKALGFRVVPNAFNEITVSLQSGMTDALYAPPALAAVFQWFAFAPYMLDLPISPAVGGVIFTEGAWKRIPKKYHEEIITSSKRVAKKFYEQSEKINNDALRIMKQNNLKITQLNDSEREKWSSAFADVRNLTVGESGKMINPEIYNKVQSLLEELR